MRMADQPTHRGGIGQWSKRYGDGDSVGLFLIAGAKLIEGDRCDTDRYGPVGYHRWDDDAGRCVCGSNDRPSVETGHHTMTMGTIDWVDIVYPALPYGYILYTEHKTAEQDERALIECPIAARTLPELLRHALESEWAFLHGKDDMGGRGEVAHRVLQHIGLPDEFRAWLLDEVPPQRLQRFMEGDRNARERTSSPWLSGAFDDWLTDKICSVDRTFGR